MREIKFRALHEGKWWYSDDEAYLLKEYEGVLWLVEDNNFYCDFDPAREKYSKIGRAIQYTGLKDKNGVEIYEGDIVNMPIDGEFFKTEITFTVDRDFNGWEITDQNVEDGAEVIGNIYQNKDLLEN